MQEHKDIGNLEFLIYTYIYIYIQKIASKMAWGHEHGSRSAPNPKDEHQGMRLSQALQDDARCHC
jgi:hypothetical protein